MSIEATQDAAARHPRDACAVRQPLLDVRRKTVSDGRRHERPAALLVRLLRRLRRRDGGSRGRVVAMKGAFWTAAEDAILREHYPTGNTRMIAELTGKSRVAIRMRAARLGIQCRPRWSLDADRNLRDVWGHVRMVEAVASTGHTRVAVYKRAAQLGLGCGCPVGYEYLTSSARRVGVAPAMLRRILNWAGVAAHRALVHATGAASYRHHYVDPALVNAAVADWLKTETPADAARRYGTYPQKVRAWLRAAKGAGVEMPLDPSGPGGRREWRIPSETIDAVVARHGWRPIGKAREEKMRRCA
jgi:hypothetical protein